MPVIHTLDLHYLGIPKAIAAYVIVGSGGPVLIETGPASTLDRLREGLHAIGLQLADIRHALVTHIHLDHAGAAGHLAQQGTRIYVHEFGAKHLIDPARLIESAARIYGAQMDRLWGALVPVPADQITALHDGAVIEVGDIRLTAIETPGHARHHHAFALGNICFAGDVAGISVPTIAPPPLGRFLSVPTPPPEFDPPAWHASIDRLLQMNFDQLYLTHFGPCKAPAVHLHRLHALLDEHAEFIRRALEAGRPRQEILRAYIDWNRREAHADGVTDADFAHYVSTNLLTMNVDGIIRYWTRPQPAASLSR